MSCPTLEIDNIIVPTQSLLTFSQNYTDLRGENFERVASGDGVLRTLWSGKIETQINGEGWAPSAFDNLEIGKPYTLRCAMIRAATDADETVPLPAARRTDAGHLPIGFALVGQLLVETPILNISGSDLATLQTVAGAVGYRVHYYPELVVAVTVNTNNYQNDGTFQWSIVAQEL